ncbi:MAG: hypothetical protein IH780_00450 [Thaumarchaeota archaeon]|nr:hypothetical protein [Nitrososphaerota archaeon]
MAIIGAILLGGGVIFANEINQFLPGTSVNLLDSIKNDFGKIKDDTFQSAETRVEGTIVTVTNEVNNIQEKSSELLSKSPQEVADSTQKGIKEVADSTQKGIKEVADSTQKGIKEITKITQETIFGGNGNNQNTYSNEEHEDGNSSTTLDNGNTVTQTNNESKTCFLFWCW